MRSRDQFRGMSSCNSESTKAIIKWTHNFDTFLDSLFQLTVLEIDTRSLRVPTSVDELIIDVKNQTNVTDKEILAEYHKEAGIVR